MFIPIPKHLKLRGFTIIVRKQFFAISVWIKISLLLAAHPSIQVKGNRWCCTSLRELFNEPLLRRVDKKPRTQRESNPRSLDFESSALPLCCNNCLKL